MVSRSAILVFLALACGSTQRTPEISEAAPTRKPRTFAYPSLSATSAKCASTADLSGIGRAIKNAIEADGVADQSTVSRSRLFAECNKFEATLVDGPEIFGAMKTEISSARHQVDLSFGVWNPRSDGVRLIGEGLKAAQSAVEPGKQLLVRIVIANTPSPLESTPISDVAESVAAWNLDPSKVKVRLAIFHGGFGFLHQKLMIKDAWSVVVTGANPEPQHDDISLRWRDTGYLLRGDIGLAAFHAFEDTWGLSKHWTCNPRCVETAHPLADTSWVSGEMPAGLGAIPMMVADRVGNTHITSNRTDNPQDQAWLAAMRNAKSTIHIETPNMNDDAFQDAVVDAIGRGVTVKLITGLAFNRGFFSEGFPGQGGLNEQALPRLRRRILRSHPDKIGNFWGCWYSQMGFRPVIDKGTEENPRPASHAKFMSVDGQVAIVGSGNMDTQSWNHSREFNVVIDDSALVAQIENAFFTRDFERSICEAVDFFDEENGSGEPVCGLWAKPDYGLDWTDDEGICDSDRARSAIIYHVPAGVSIRLFDNSSGSRDDDWVEIWTERDVIAATIGTFETSAIDSNVRRLAFYDTNLNGKVSRIDVKRDKVVVSHTPYGEACLDNTVFPVDLGTVFLYQDKGLRRKWTRITYPDHVPNLDEGWRCDGKRGFGDMTSSARFNLAPGIQFRLFDDHGYRDRVRLLSGAGSIRDFGGDYNFDDKTSSGRWELTSIDSIHKATVELFDDTGQKGRRVRLTKDDDNISDFDAIDFEDKASSARWQIPVGWKFVMFDDKDYRDTRRALWGEGVFSHEELGNFGDKASSGRWEKVHITAVSEARVELFEDKHFKGDRKAISPNQNVPNFNALDFNDELSSARWQIPDGWKVVLYEHANYGGSHRTLAGNGTYESESDYVSFNDEASSLKWMRE